MNNDLSYMETLIEKNGVKSIDRWSPSMVCEFERALYQGAFNGMKHELRKNIVYSLQYLQYIQLQLEELILHSVITTQLWKSYIIISMGIVEGIFYHLLKVSGNQNKTEWEEKSRVSTNVYKDSGVDTKNEIITYRKLSTAVEARMDFEAMIAKVRSKHLLKLPQAAYPYIKELKEIRNKVHLHISKKDYETDYNKLSVVDYYLARYVLYRILTDGVFSPEKYGNKFDWIRLTKDQEIQMSDTLTRRRKDK